MRLNDPLITSFKYNQVEYEIDLAFDNVLDVFDALSEKELRHYEKAEICLELLVGEDFKTNIDELNEHERIKHVVDLWNYIFDKFIYTKPKQMVEYDLKGNALIVKEDEEEERYIDLKQDAGFIFASFKQAYNINLFQEQGQLHWREFQELLNGLPSTTIMKRVIEIRAWKPGKHDSAESRAKMEKAQRRVALQPHEGEEGENG